MKFALHVVNALNEYHYDYQSTRHTVILSHGQLVTCVLSCSQHVTSEHIANYLHSGQVAPGNRRRNYGQRAYNKT